MKKLLVKLFTLTFLIASAIAFAESNPKTSMEALTKRLQRYGEIRLSGEEQVGEKKVPILYFGKKKINKNYDVVDEIKKGFWGNATIFVRSGNEFVRVSTNVLKDDGTRAIGTELAHNIAYEKAMKGESFCGELEILKIPHNTCYQPIKDQSGNVVALYYVGYKK